MKHILSLLALALTLFTAINAIDANADWRGGGGRPGWSNPGRPGNGGPGWGGPGWSEPGRPGNGGPGWGNPGRPGNGGPGWGNPQPNVTCTATDNGWEEHWGGHSSCQECKAKHGTCAQTCSTQSYNCRATGTNNLGRAETFESYATDEYQARNEALDRCYRMGARDCRSADCSTSTQIVSRGQCQ
jgi:hypothetical protein